MKYFIALLLFLTGVAVPAAYGMQKEVKIKAEAKSEVASLAPAIVGKFQTQGIMHVAYYKKGKRIAVAARDGIFLYNEKNEPIAQVQFKDMSSSVDFSGLMVRDMSFYAKGMKMAIFCTTREDKNYLVLCNIKEQKGEGSKIEIANKVELTQKKQGTKLLVLDDKNFLLYGHNYAEFIYKKSDESFLATQDEHLRAIRPIDCIAFSSNSLKVLYFDVSTDCYIIKLIGTEKSGDRIYVPQDQFYTETLLESTWTKSKSFFQPKLVVKNVFGGLAEKYFILVVKVNDSADKITGHLYDAEDGKVKKSYSISLEHDRYSLDKEGNILSWPTIVQQYDRPARPCASSASQKKGITRHKPAKSSNNEMRRKILLGCSVCLVVVSAFAAYKYAKKRKLSAKISAIVRSMWSQKNKK